MRRYVPYVGDSKRAMDEYTSEIFLGGKVCILILIHSVFVTISVTVSLHRTLL